MGARVWHNDNWSHTRSYYCMRCSSFQKLINRSLRSPSLFLSLARTLCLTFFLHRFPVCLALYYSSRGLCPVARACPSVCSPARAVVCFCCRGGDPDKPVFGAHSLYSYSYYYYYYQPTPPLPQIPRIHRRLGISVSLGPGRSSVVRARPRSPTNLRIVFHYYYFSLRSEKIARIASSDRLSPSRVGSSAANKNNIYFLFFNFNYHHWEYYNMCGGGANIIIIIHIHTFYTSASVQCAAWCVPPPSTGRLIIYLSFYNMGVWWGGTH